MMFMSGQGLQAFPLLEPADHRHTFNHRSRMPKMKTCTKCNEAKSFQSFSAQLAGLNGLTAACKTCNKTYRDAWRAKNTERTAATSAAWYVANPLFKVAYAAAHYAANKEYKAALGAAWRKANPGRTEVNSAAWRKANPEKNRIYKHNRRAKERVAGGKLSVGLAARLFVLQNGKCPCCNQSLGKKYHLDHIMPIALGGQNIDNNIQLLRSTCNHQKLAKHPIDFMQQRGFLL